jgi:cation diffusion facilitator family transporter
MSQAASPHPDPAHAGHGTPADERSRAGLRAVGMSLVVLLATACAQAFVFILSGSAALLADLIHNVGDALTAIPLGLAFLLRSAQGERRAGVMVVLAIVVSMVVAAASAIEKLINRQTPDHLVVLAIAGAIGVLGNGVAAKVRSRAGEKLDSPALVADGHHAKIDATVSGGVILSAGAVALGFPIVDPLIALAITVMIGHIALEAWATVHGRGHVHPH